MNCATAIRGVTEPNGQPEEQLYKTASRRNSLRGILSKAKSLDMISFNFIPPRMRDAASEKISMSANFPRPSGLTSVIGVCTL